MTAPASGPGEPENEPERSHEDATADGAPSDDTAAPELTPPSASEVIGGALAQAARRAGIDPTMRQSAGSVVWASIGGVRGILEAVLPSLVFVVTYTLTYSATADTGNLPLALGLSVGLAALFTAARLIARSAASSAIGGLVAAMLAAGLALVTGRGEDNYVFGFFTNGAYGAAFLISVLVGWPLIGLIAGFLTGTGTTWRENRRQRRVAAWLSLMWAGLFAIRLSVQLPLYFAGNVIALGALKLAMGIPLFAPALVVSYLVARSVFRVAPDEASP